MSDIKNNHKLNSIMSSPYVIALFISAICAFVLTLIVSFLSRDYDTSSLGGNVTDILGEEHIEQVVGYEREGNHFVRTAEDCYIIFKQFDDPIGSASIQVHSDKQALYDVKMYYVQPGLIFTEGSQIEDYIDQDVSEILNFNIPRDYYGYIRFDIDVSEFDLLDVSIGSENLAYAHRTFSPRVFFLLFLLVFIVANVCIVIQHRCNLSKKTWIQYSILCIVSFSLFFFTQFLNISNDYFYTDEGDNFLGGLFVSKGLDVYSDFVSQHMPLMYYLCGVFAWIGARTVFEFRLCYYLFMSLVWTIVMLRYRKDFGTIPMILAPILYILAISADGELSTTILTDQLQAFGLGLLFLEYLLYLKKDAIDLGSQIAISIAIFTAFGSAFVAAFSIAVIVIYVLIREIGFAIQYKSNDKSIFSVFWARNSRLLGIVILPFVVLAGIYVVKGCLYDAYYGAYVVNTKYYSQYYPVGGSVLDTIKAPFTWYRQIMDATTPYLRVGIIAVLILAVYLCAKKKIVAAIVLYLYIIWTGTRGFVGYHSLSYHYITMLAVAVEIGSIGKLIARCKKHEKLVTIISWIVPLVVGLSLIVLIYPSYYARVGYIDWSFKENKPSRSSYYRLIDKLTVKNHQIYTVGINIDLYMNTDCIPVAADPACIWIYQAYREDIMSKLSDGQPDVIIMPDEVTIWDYSVNEFGKDIYDYVYLNYTAIGYGDIYIRNGYLDEAQVILDKYGIIEQTYNE